MKFENTDVWGFEHALRGMRNPLESWSKADSFHGLVSTLSGDSETDLDVAFAWVNNFNDDSSEENIEKIDKWLLSNGVIQNDKDAYRVSFIGPEDMRCAQKLIKAGPEHRKFLRQIFVSVDITAPLYWWKEADTYKIGTTANSTSTMHKIHSKPISLDCFELGDWNKNIVNQKYLEETLIPFLENLRLNYLNLIQDAKELSKAGFEKEAEAARKEAKACWKELIRWLPESWLQTRTITMSYENILTMYFQRKNHKLKEWSIDFIKWVENLPYAKEFITQQESFCNMANAEI